MCIKIGMSNPHNNDAKWVLLFCPSFYSRKQAEGPLAPGGIKPVPLVNKSRDVQGLFCV